MPLHDRRYKKLHRPKPVNLEWTYQVSDMLDLGEVKPDSLVPHKVEYLTEELTLRLADHAWSFQTDRRAGLLLMMEFQSRTDAALMLRQYTYAFMHLLTGLETKEYNLQTGLPIPILVSLYNGRQKWQPRPLENLFAGGLEGTFPLPWIHYDMLHMESGHLPTRPLLRAIFDIERTGRHNEFNYAAVLQNYLGDDPDPEIHRALFAFTIATMGRWQHAKGPDGTPLHLDVEWEAIGTLEELIMAQEMLQTQLDSWISAGRAEGRTEGRAEGRTEGRAEGRMEGRAEGRMEGEIGERRRALLDLAAVWLKPPEVEECRVALDRMTLDEMPTVRDLYQALQDATEMPTVRDLYQDLQDATEARAALLALLRPPASA